MTDFNTPIIEEFRANAGKVGGPFEGAPMILVHHKGAKTGTERVSPLVYQRVGDAFAIFASKGGAPSHPHWYLNLLENPHATAEVSGKTLEVRARTAEGEERTRMGALIDYLERQQALTTREIPVVILEPVQ